MAPLPTIAGVYRVAFNWTAGTGISAANVMHFHNPAGTIAGLQAALVANVAAGMWNGLTATAVIGSYDITPLDAATATVTYIAPSTAAWKGAQTGDFLTADSLLVKLVTGLRGRDKRGRIYLPFVGETTMAGGVVNSAINTTMQTAWNTFRTAMGTSNYDPGVASYKYSAFTPVGTYVVEGASAVQRRRQTRIRKSLGY